MIKPIRIVRGRSNQIALTILGDGGQPVSLTADDLIKFGVKSNPNLEELLVYKELTGSDQADGVYTFTLMPSDTADLDAGVYYYDIGVQMESGEYFTVIEYSRFDLIPNITSSETGTSEEIDQKIADHNDSLAAHSTLFAGKLDVSHATDLDAHEELFAEKLDVDEAETLLADKQDKTDVLLATTDKTVVGAINELKSTKSNPDGYYGESGGVYQFSTNFLGKNAPQSVHDLVYRPTASQMSGQAWVANSVDGKVATIERIKGRTLVWNQLLHSHARSMSSDGITASYSSVNKKWMISGTATLTTGFWLDYIANSVAGHKYLLFKNNSDLEMYYIDATHLVDDYKNAIFYTETSDRSCLYVGIMVRTGRTYNEEVGMQAYDLTQMFGPGNEPSTVEEFKAMFPLDYYAYDPGRLINFTGTGLKTVGFNQFYPDGHIDVLPYVTYKIEGTYTSLKDSDGNDVTVSNGEFTSTKRDIYTMVGGSCVHIKWSGFRDGETEEHWAETLSLPIATYFPDGMNGVGASCDELEKDKSVERIGAVNLGTINWSRQTVNSISIFRQNSGFLNSKHRALGICAKYSNAGTVSLANLSDKSFVVASTYWDSNNRIAIRDDSYTDAASFKAAMSGVMLYYERRNPIITPISPELNLSYKVDDHGTEQSLPENGSEPTTAPMDADIVYQIDYEAQIRNNSQLNITKESMDNFVEAFNDSGLGEITQTWNPTEKKYEYEVEASKDILKTIAITDQSITLGKISDILDEINEDGDHVLFDVSALGAKMYLCTISIDTTSNTYTILDLVLGRTASGEYSASKLLTMAIAQATNIATQKQIDRLQEEIDEIGGSERIKNLEVLGDLILSGESEDLISPGDSIDFNWVKSVLATTTHGLTVTCSDEDLFINGVGECEEKDYLLIYNGTAWTYNESAINLAEWGLSVSGTPQTGEVMTVNVTVDPVEYVFTGYDDMTPHDSSVPHNWLMEQKYAPTTKVLDPEEALFAVYAGKSVPAGNYHLRRYCYRSSFNIDCYFTLSSAMGDANSIIQACYNARLTGQEITNADGVTKIGVEVVSKLQPKVYKTGANAGTVFNITYTPASGVQYVDLDSLNVEGQDPVVYLGSFDKCVFGNNQYEDTTMFQWLNDDTKGDNYEPSHMCDVAASYNRNKGYLWGLDPRVKALMLDCDIKCIAGYENIGHERNAYYDVTAKVFLLSMKEMSFNIATGEGNATDLYSEYTGGTLHNNACEGRAKYNKAGGTLNSYRWSRTAHSDYAYLWYRVASSGANNYRSACYGNYFAPAFIIGKASQNQ